MRKANLLFVVAIAMFFASCGTGSKAKKDSGKLTGSISIDGSSTVYPITEAVAEEFRAVEPALKVTIGVSGTGGGFKKFGRGETDISNASRPIKDSEIELCKENNIHYHGITIAYDGMAVIINPENDWVDYLTVEELKKIWEPAAQGVILKWNQIRPEWPDKEIHLFGPGVASGTFDYFTEVIVGKSGSSRGDFTASEDDNVLVQGVKGDVNALGFFGFAYYEENHESLKLVPIDNGNGPVSPNLETVSSNTYSPLSRPIFIYVNSLAAKRTEVVEFIRFYLESAKVLSQEVGYIPLPDEKYLDETQKFEAYLESLSK